MPAPQFTIEYTDGTKDQVKLLPKAQLAFEKETGKSITENFGQSMRDLYLLAWYAAEKPQGTLEAWIENVEAVTGQDELEGDDAPKPASTDQLPD